MIQGTLGPSRSFQGIQENKTTFIIILRWRLTFILSSHKNMVAFSRRYLTCDDITNSRFVRYVFKCLNIHF